MRDDDMELAMKIVIVGNGVVGKSSMIQRFCKGVFSNQYKKTLGVDFLERIVRVKSENIRLMLWDTAGQEEFDAITKAYYRGANACLIVFSTTDRDSFLSIDKWKSKVEFECGHIPMAIVQNKMDLSHQTLVDRHEVESCAKRLKCKLFRTSVKDNVNVENVFQFLAESYIDSLNDDYNEEPVLPLYPNISNTRPSNPVNPFAQNPLFNHNVGHYSLKYDFPSNKMAYNRYINPGHGMGLHSMTNNSLLSHYRYKSRFGGRPLHQTSPSIFLHRQQYQHLLHRQSLSNHYNYNSYSSDHLFKSSFFKTCRIF